jgi:hypothetical protein
LQKKITAYQNQTIFFHPDFTVGAGISPVQFESRPRKGSGAFKVAGYNRR